MTLYAILKDIKSSEVERMSLDYSIILVDIMNKISKSVLN